jgi:hypothetical protein
MKAMEATTNLVIRPCDGYVVTVSGRWIPQPPWIFPDDRASVIAYNDWLIRQARTAAVELEEDCILHRLENMEAQQMDEPLCHLLSDFLFGQSSPVFEAREGIR